MAESRLYLVLLHLEWDLYCVKSQIGQTDTIFLYLQKKRGNNDTNFVLYPLSYMYFFIYSSVNNIHCNCLVI